MTTTVTAPAVVVPTVQPPAGMQTATAAQPQIPAGCTLPIESIGVSRSTPHLVSHSSFIPPASTSMAASTSFTTATVTDAATTEATAESAAEGGAPAPVQETLLVVVDKDESDLDDSNNSNSDSGSDSEDADLSPSRKASDRFLGGATADTVEAPTSIPPSPSSARAVPVNSMCGGGSEDERESRRLEDLEAQFEASRAAAAASVDGPTDTAAATVVVVDEGTAGGGEVLLKQALEPVEEESSTLLPSPENPISEAFCWLGWSPNSSLPIGRALSQFRGALPSSAIFARIQKTLEEYGVNRETTVLATSLCPEVDHIGRGTLLSRFIDEFGPVVTNLGGLGGAPFAGRSGFRSLASKVPDNGGLFLMYGPHISVSEDGTIGRVGNQGSGGSAIIEAYEDCLAAPGSTEDPADLQASWLRSQLGPRIARIQASPNEMVGLAREAYEVIDQQLRATIMGHRGLLMLLGGVSVRLPVGSGYEDHFVPLTFEVSTEPDLSANLLSNLELPAPTCSRA